MEKILMDTKTLADALSLSQKTIVKIGTEADAKIQVGRAVRWEVSKIMDYLRGNKK